MRRGHCCVTLLDVVALVSDVTGPHPPCRKDRVIRGCCRVRAENPVTGITARNKQRKYKVPRETHSMGRMPSVLRGLGELGIL